MAASLLVNPTGTNNSYTVTALVAGAAGNRISHELNSPSESASSVGVVGDMETIVITPAAKGRMSISGPSPAVASELFYASHGISSGQARFTHDGVADYTYGNLDDAGRTALFSASGTWYLWHTDSSGVFDYYATKVSAAATPEGLTGWTVSIGTNQPTIAAAASSAAQIIAAINANVDAGALVLAEASGTVTGAVAAVAAEFLSGGEGPNTPPVVFDP